MTQNKNLSTFAAAVSRAGTFNQSDQVLWTQLNYETQEIWMKQLKFAPFVASVLWCRGETCFPRFSMSWRLPLRIRHYEGREHFCSAAHSLWSESCRLVQTHQHRNSWRTQNTSSNYSGNTHQISCSVLFMWKTVPGLQKQICDQSYRAVLHEYLKLSDARMKMISQKFTQMSDFLHQNVSRLKNPWWPLKHSAEINRI